ncbi:MAG: glutaredoxin family protein [Thermoplasmata archaeon]
MVELKFEHIAGKNKGKFKLFALSTCGWCKKTKHLLSDLGVEYYYVFLDALEEERKIDALKELERWNPRCSFPTLIINDKRCIVGFNEQKIREAIG